MEEALTRRVRQPESQMEAAEGERKGRHRQGRLQPAGPVPAEPRRLGHVRRDQQAGVVTELELEQRRLDGLTRLDLDRQRERLAGEELLPLLPVSAEETRRGDHRLSGAPFPEPGAALGRVELVRERPPVADDRLVRRPVEGDLATVQEHGALAQALDRARVV